VIAGLDRGIDLGGRSAYLYSCRVGRNEVLAGTSGGIFATGAVMPGASLEVIGNKIATSGTGITVGPDATVDSNAVNALAFGTAGPSTNVDVTGVSATARGTDGIVIDSGDFTTQAGHVRITGNRVHDRSGTGIAVRTAVQTLIVKENVVTDAGAGILIESDGAAERAAIDNNEVLDIQSPVEGVTRAIGIGVIRAGSLSIVGNTVAQVGLTLPNALLRAGILVIAANDIRVSGNVVDRVGTVDGFTGLAVGIGVFGPFAAASVSDNSSRFSPDAAGPSQGNWWALLVESVASEITSFGENVSTVPVNNGIIVMTGNGAYLAPTAAEHAGVSSNMLAGGGTKPTCLVRVTGDLVAQGNQALHEGGEEPIAVRLAAKTITAATNRLRGTRSMLVLDVDPKSMAAVGNLAPGGTHVGAPGGAIGALPAPWQALNPSVP
jgi:hypothetical protein